MEKRALITGITGQDGSHLAEYLLELGYEVHGVVRRTSFDSLDRLSGFVDRVQIHSGDLLDGGSLVRVLRDVRPREVYNLAAQSFVPTSWKQPVLTGEITGLGVARLLEAIRLTDPTIRFYQASSSEMFGLAEASPQNEKTRFHPRSPYGVAKVYGHHLTVNYRESYDMFCASGILFNHTSPRRGLTFVTRKVTDAVARIELGLDDTVRLGNLDARRDWGYAGDYVRAMHLMLQQDEPDDYVIGTGRTHSVRELCRIAFEVVGRDFNDHIAIDERFMRPADVQILVADASKAKKELGWEPSVSFEQLIGQMVEADIERHQRRGRKLQLGTGS